jgi:5-formyltetrahydrofolate cyclo-ligase
LKRRDGLNPGERDRASSLIRQRIIQHPKWRAAGTVLFYVSFGSEVETHTLLREALRFNKRVVVPVHDKENKDTPLSELRRFNELGTSHRGVLQVMPEFRRTADPVEVELAIIPGIVFDRKGGRIGFGGGFFDRLLPRMPDAYRMALAYSDQLSPTPLPLESFDVRMQVIVTEKELLSV